MSWTEVDAWRGRLRALSPEVGLSSQGARYALDSALDALDAVPEHLDREAPAHTVIVAASTVFTAPLEWAAVLLARGGRVTIKAPRSLQGWFAQVAAATELPLSSTADRQILDQADCVVAMGSDETLHAISSRLRTDQRLLGFGHRYSLAFWSDPAQADAVALDLALYDGRGCMSPLGIVSPLPDATQLLCLAMERLQRRLPRGEVGALEAAKIRERGSLARVLGSAASGAEWAVHSLPIGRFPNTALPRAALIHPGNLDTFSALVAQHLPHLSTVGTDTPVQAPGVRVCDLGEMQRPELHRHHDGVDWLRVL